NAMVRAADALAGPLHDLSSPGISVSLTGDSALWADFNAVNRSAMLRSEMLSWPVTLVILVLAFGSLVAAGLPLMLTMVGLMLAVAAVLAATLTLLPAVLGRLGTRINAGRLIGRRSKEKASRLDDRLHAWGRLLWRHPLPAGLAALGVLLLAALPVLGLRTNM